jgi:TonB-dependent receptor
MKFKSVTKGILAGVFVLLALSVLVSTAAGQGKGTINGKITDSSGGVLQGAHIELQPNGIVTVSNERGEFFISGLDSGSYKLTVSYVGFKSLTKDVAVSAGQSAGVEAKLEVESQNLEVLVTAERASGEAEEINRQRTADNVMQVLTSDVIRSLPNANMADALGRLPSVTIERDEGEGKYVQVRGTEPRLTNTTINGINVPSPESGVRQIKFDAIPADIVESVEINKTLQANMDGDGIGGSVNLVTKTPGERPTVSVSGMGGYTPILGGRSLVETAGTVGQRFGANKRLGLLIGGTYDWNGRGIDDIEPVPDVINPGASQALTFDQIEVREYRYYRSRWGLAGGADYKLGDGSNIYLRGLYSDFHNYGDRWDYVLTDNTPFLNLAGSNGCPPPTGGAVFLQCTGVPTLNVQQRRPDYSIGSVVLGGKHVLSTTWYSWDVAVSRSSQTGQVGDRNADFTATALSTSNCQFDPANTKNPYNPQFTAPCFTEAYNQSNFTLDGVSVSKGLSAQLNLQATGAMAKRYHLGSHLASIEIGGKFRNAHKFDNTFKVNYSPNGTISETQFPSRFSNSDYYQGAYKLGPNPSFPEIFSFVNGNLGQFTVSDDSAGNTNNYSLIEKVSAGYLMNSIDFSKVRLVAGVRFEGTNLDTKAPLFDQNGNLIGVSRASGSYVKILPSASARIALTHDTYLRLVYSRGLSRPDPQDIAQAVTVDTSTTPVAVSLGNPNLKAETADNVDILVEHYINPFGIISAGYFYKNLTDPIVQGLTRVQSGPFGGANCPCNFTQMLNGGSAWLNGFEAAYLQHLTFLPGIWRGLGISANYGYTASRASGLPGRSDHPRLIRNAPHTWNVSPTYDRGRVSVRVGLSYNSANINAYQFQDGAPGGIKGPFGDDYFFAHLQVDAQGSVRLSHGFSFVMYGLDLTNEVFGFYFGSTQFFHQREYYRPTVAAGFRWSPSFEHK